MRRRVVKEQRLELLEAPRAASDPVLSTPPTPLPLPPLSHAAAQLENQVEAAAAAAAAEPTRRAANHEINSLITPHDLAEGEGGQGHAKAKWKIMQNAAAKENCSNSSYWKM